MDILFLIIAFLPAAAGVWLIGDFLIWEARGTKTAGEIVEFSKVMDKGVALPVVSFVTEKGAQKATAKRIDQMMYLLSRPEAGNVTDIIYIQHEEDKPVELRIYGFLNAGAGLLLFIPFIIALGSWMGKSLAVTQGVFFLIFALIFGGGLVLLKLIQRIY